MEMFDPLRLGDVTETSTMLSGAGPSDLVQLGITLLLADSKDMTCVGVDHMPEWMRKYVKPIIGRWSGKRIALAISPESITVEDITEQVAKAAFAVMMSCGQNARASLAAARATPEIASIRENMMTQFDEPVCSEKKSRKKRKRDDDEPKRPVTDFILFSNSERPSIREANPSLKMGEIGKLLGAKWQTLGEDGKARWRAEAAVGREEYAKKKRVYDEAKVAAAEEAKVDEANVAAVHDADAMNVDDVNVDTN